MQTVQKAIDCLGGQAKLARAIRVRPDEIYKYINHIAFPSARVCVSIENVTDSKIKAEEVLMEVAKIKSDILRNTIEERINRKIEKLHDLDKIKHKIQIAKEKINDLDNKLY